MNRARATGLLASLFFSFAACGATIIDTDFGRSDQPITGGNGQPKERVTGVLPKGWLDNSEWAKVWAHTTVQEEEGRRYLHCQITRKETGAFQLCFNNVPDLQGETLFRLTVRARNFTSGPVQMGLRMQGEPYTFYWQVTERLSKAWNTRTYEFNLAKNDKPMGFFLIAQDIGEVDLMSLRLELLTQDDLVAELKAKYPDEGPANLMRNSHLPLGLQNGWALDRERSDDEVKIDGDRQTPGPTGVPALKIDAPDGALLRIEPFGVCYPIVEHKAVLSARGRGAWKMDVRCGSKHLGSKSFTAGDDWQRVELPFTPKLLEPVYEWTIEGKGTLWIDALQVGPTSKTATFSPPDKCEVALACPPGEAAAARVQFEDEPAEVRYAVTGTFPGATLKTRVVDLYGRQTALPDVELGDGALIEGQLRFDAPGTRAFGGFRIEAWVERDGKTVSPINELVLYRLPRPRYWKRDAPNSPFGTHTLSTTRHILMAKAIGVNWTRFHDAGLEYIGWWNLETKPGEWRFFDKEIQRYRTHGMKIFAELGTAPGWASYYEGSGKKGFGYFDKFFQPRDLNQYANYVKTVVERYKGVIDAWDVWNEPWIHAWWGVKYDSTQEERAGYITSEHPQADFAKLMKTAFTTAKAGDPQAIVAGFNSTTGGGWKHSFGGTEWTAGVLESGGMDSCDVIDYHHYTNEMAGYPEDVVSKGLTEAIAPIREKLGQVPKPVWMTEGNGAIGMGACGFYKHTLPYEDQENYTDTANRLCRYVASLLAHDVKRIFLYSMHCHNSFSPRPHEWSVFVTQEGYLHPAGAAHAIMAWHLEDTHFVKFVTLADGVWAMLFEGDGHAVAVLTVKPGSAAYRLRIPEGVKAVDLFGNPLSNNEPLDERLVYLSGKLKATVLEQRMTAP